MRRACLAAFFLVFFACAGSLNTKKTPENTTKRVRPVSKRVSTVKKASFPSTFEYPDELATQAMEEKMVEEAMGDLERRLAHNEAFKEVVGDEEPKKEASFKEQFPFSSDRDIHNDRVQFYIKYFQTTGRKVFSRWLSRSERYVPMMKEILKKHGLPEGLVYLAMIESGFNPKAYSRRGACGPWQFMYRTGKKYGLRVDRWVDERRDPIKATIAAAKYLKDLYDMFNSWHLAVAGYNAGEGKIMRAIKRYKTEDFWELCKYRYLKTETKDYIPKLIAAALIAENPEKYGFTNIKYQDPLRFDEITVSGPVSLSVIAKCCGVSVDEIRNLNPELRKNFTPPNRNSYTLRIPFGTKELFLERFAKIPPKERVGFVEHRIRRGESLWVIARRYGVSIYDIKAVNRIRNPKRLRPGKVILIPITKEELRLASTKLDPSLLRSYRPRPRPRKRRGFYYRVRRGDSLWTIARRFGISLRKLKRYNRSRIRGVLRPGMRLYIPPR